ncbi:MAG: CDP-alcohol phosphatidyltransferase family protein [Kofleriaceae bacterium]
MAAFLVYCGMCAIGKPPVIEGVKHNQVFGFFFARYVCWLLFPIERLLVGRVSPNTITAASLLGCVATGIAAALGHLAWALWLFILSGILDVLDGRLARITNKQTQSGALFDSVSDRWGELIVFSGYAYFMRDTIWLLAVLGAIAGSMMVSYTRARAEGLGIELHGGVMQRAERIFLVSLGTLVAAWFGVDPAQRETMILVLGGTMLLTGVASTATALNRWIVAYRVLARRDAEAAGHVISAVEPSKPAVKPPAVVSEPLFASVPKSLRESAELPL